MTGGLQDRISSGAIVVILTVAKGLALVLDLALGEEEVGLEAS